MKKIIYEGENYYFNKGAIYDSSFIEMPKSVSQKVLKEYYKSINYEILDEAALQEFIKDLKNSEIYEDCLKVIHYGLDKFNTSVDFYQVVFPMITSCYRALKEPQKAIDFWMENKHIFKVCLSVPLLTSLAAAYCDVGDYVLAKKCADRAYAIQGGGLNYKNELSLVYKRIQKETEER